MLDCDYVFMVLTRGPFPTGDPADAVVEAHLLRCAGCRELAEALRPAPQFCHESVSPEESRSLPGYWSLEVPVAKAVGEFEFGSGNELPRPAPRRRVPSRDADMVANLLWFVGAVLCGVMLAGTLSAIIGTAPVESHLFAEDAHLNDTATQAEAIHDPVAAGIGGE